MTFNMTDPTLATSAALVLTPVIAFLVSFLDVFDIKYKGAKEWFEKLGGIIKERKLSEWRHVVNGAQVEGVDSMSTEISDEYIGSLIKRVEEVYSLQKSLKNCRFWFHFYYGSLLVIFVGGVLHGLLTLIMRIPSVIKITSEFQGLIILCTILYATVGFAFLFVKKLMLEKKHEKFTEI